MTLHLTVEPSNIVACQQEIATIASATNLGFGTNIKIGEVPDPSADIDAVDSNQNPIHGWPWFAVRQPRHVSFAINTDISGSADTNLRGIQQIEPVWDLDCYALYQYKPDIPNYSEAINALVVLTQNFLENYTLNGTCSLANPHSWSLPYVTLGGVTLVAARFTIRVYEMLGIDYGP